MSVSSSSPKGKSKDPKVSWKTATLRIISLLAWVVASFIGAQLLVALGFGAVFALFPALGDVSESALQFVLAASIYTLTFVLILVGSLLMRQRFSAAELGVNKPITWLDIIISPAAFIGYMIVSSILAVIVSSLVPGFNIEQAQDVGFQNLAGNADLLLAFISLVVVTPIAEEVIFRGYLYGRLRKYTSVVVAALLTSVLFGAVHMQWNVAIDTFMLSLVMCGLREITGSIWAGTILHMIKNGLAFFLLFIYPTL